MRVCTLNVEGLASALDRGLGDWLAANPADACCLQEIWSRPKAWERWPDSLAGRHALWNPSRATPGNSGTALLTTFAPRDASFTCGVERMDNEGRWIMVDAGPFQLVNLYLPYFWSGDPSKQKQSRRLLGKLDAVFDELLADGKETLIAGDFNIAPPLHRDYTGTLDLDDSSTWPYKKVWMKSLLDKGLRDLHSELGGNEDAITWHADEHRGNPRGGTRIDYLLATAGLAERATRMWIDCSVGGTHKERITDHCAVFAEFDF